MERYAVGFARPDRWVQPDRSDEGRPWHAVEAHRPVSELDGEVELAVCGAIVQVWGRQDWDRIVTGRTVCEECRRLTTVNRAAGRPPAPASPRDDAPRLRVVS